MSGWDILLSAARVPSAALCAALEQPEQQQLALLQRIVHDNAGSTFGRAHGFATIATLQDYRARVPVQSYAAFAPYIAAVAGGQGGVLTQAPVIAFEETGGTAAGAKLIPYTQASLDSFRAAVLPWLADLAQRRPGIMAGSTYVSLSPATRQPRVTPGGIPVGLASEAAYLGDDLAPAFAALLAVPPDVGALADVDAWRLATLAHLVGRDDLSFVSVWSPTFFLELVAALPALADALGPILALPARQRLTRALRGPLLDTVALWPRLDTISCWTDAGSAGFAQRLAALCPQARLEPKGLLATEAAITLPLGDAPGCVPALTSAFVEYLDDSGTPWLAHELREGARYSIVITTHGGLCRYAMGDSVRCIAFDTSCPRLVFEGRSGVTSDMVGEKLDEAFVARALAGLGAPAALVPKTQGSAHYELWVDDAEADLAGATMRVEAALRTNPQYAYARDMGQLGPLVPVRAVGFVARHHRARVAAGARLGDLKAVALLVLP